MARPREFDEASALDAAMDCFWREGDEATSVRDLAARMGITGASLYNCRQSRRSAPFLARSSNAPSTAIGAAASWSTLRSKIAPHDPELGAEVVMHLGEIEAFSRRATAAAQGEGYVPPDRDPADLADCCSASRWGCACWPGRSRSASCWREWCRLLSPCSTGLTELVNRERKRL
jgi:TetR/AcrR family transcriptional regulator, transcriptional repressor for nem operon